jgi:hypothetical protein
MHVRRAITIPVIMALSVAGSVLTGSVISVAAAPVASAQVQIIASAASPSVHYHT